MLGVGKRHCLKTISGGHGAARNISPSAVQTALTKSQRSSFPSIRTDSVRDEASLDQLKTAYFSPMHVDGLSIARGTLVEKERLTQL